MCNRNLHDESDVVYSDPNLTCRSTAEYKLNLDLSIISTIEREKLCIIHVKRLLGLVLVM